MRVLALFALVACTYPDKQLDSAFACSGAAPPTTAPAIVHVTGHAVDPKNLTPLAGITVALQSAEMATISSVTTDAAGAFSFDLNTNGHPVSGLDLFATMSGLVDTYFFPSRPISADLDVPLSVLSDSEALALSQGGQFTPVIGEGSILITVDDCTSSGLAGGTLTSTPAGTIVYFSGVQPDPTLHMTDGGGVAIIANLTPGKVTVTATVQGKTLPSHDVAVVANAFSLVEIQP
jgi:hypothetical protein